MTNANDSFIDEVTEEVRRDRLYGWLRRWGWAIALAIVLVVGFAGWTEWRQAQERQLAQLRGEVLLTALELPAGPDRVAALAEVPLAGDEGVVAALLLAGEQAADGDAASAIAGLDAVAADGAVRPLYRDLASLKAQMLRGAEADRAALEALAQPGAPFGLLAQEQLAMLDLGAGDRDAAVARLQAIRADAGVTPNQEARLRALLSALGAPPAAEG